MRKVKAIFLINIFQFFLAIRFLCTSSPQSDFLNIFLLLLSLSLSHTHLWYEDMAEGRVGRKESETDVTQTKCTFLEDNKLLD